MRKFILKTFRLQLHPDRRWIDMQVKLPKNFDDWDEDKKIGYLNLKRKDIKFKLTNYF